ncbi:MAG: zinc ribbon domain-containing protein [Candidatus Pacearchaeota archaeon]
MKKCLYCNKEIESNIEICKDCGKKIWGERYEEIFNNKRKENIRKCNYCGKEVNRIIEICDDCGRKVFGDVIFKLILKKSEEEIKI